MPCHVVRLPDGTTAIVRLAKARSRRCSACGRQINEWKLCDFPLYTKTCDRVLCEKCTVHRDPDTDYCPEHAQRITPEGKLKL